MEMIDFVRESNRIEGITRAPTFVEMQAHRWVVEASCTPRFTNLIRFVSAVEPGARLRDREEVPNVRVGIHVAPSSGPEVRSTLIDILLQSKEVGPYRTHCNDLTLHPFTDGNGRSARALWLWQMGGPRNVPLGFLHTFYYQTLSAND